MHALCPALSRQFIHWQELCSKCIYTSSASISIMHHIPLRPLCIPALSLIFTMIRSVHQLIPIRVLLHCILLMKVSIMYNKTLCLLCVPALSQQFIHWQELCSKCYLHQFSFNIHHAPYSFAPPLRPCSLFVFYNDKKCTPTDTYTCSASLYSVDESIHHVQ